MPEWLPILISWLPLLVLIGGMVFFGVKLVRLGKILERIALALEKQNDSKIGP